VRPASLSYRVNSYLSGPAVAFVVLFLCGCASQLRPEPTPADAFMTQLRALCGKAFAGRIVANEPTPTTPDAFSGKALIAHVRECGAEELRIPFHVGDDHSRTWVLSKRANGLRLKHDHRHEDGSPDVLTQYGGDSVDAGRPNRQEFPVDGDSIALFQRQNLAASVSNVWAFEIEAGKVLVYELARPGANPGRLFRVEFDLSKPVTLPQAPWGSE
jgi:hypothetical protein